MRVASRARARARALASARCRREPRRDESVARARSFSRRYAGDAKRKRSLIEHGFRLPSAADNRPLTGPEFWARAPQAVFVSATPGAELAMCGHKPVAGELVLRPTAIVDPRVEVVDSSAGCEDHLLALIAKRAARGERSLVTCLTRRSAEELSAFLSARGVRAAWLHAGVKAAERVLALDALRRGETDALVGCDLLCASASGDEAERGPRPPVPNPPGPLPGLSLSGATCCARASTCPR